LRGFEHREGPDRQATHDHIPPTPHQTVAAVAHTTCMEDSPAVINLGAITISILALVISSYLATRQTRLAHQANQITIFVDLLAEARSAEFRRREREVWRNLATHSRINGFDDLPENDRANVEVVCSFYSTLAYCIAIGVFDYELALVPVKYRLLKTWRTVYPFVVSERATRGDGESYFSLLEDLVEQANAMDLQRSEQRLSRKAFPRLHGRRLRRVRVRQTNDQQPAPPTVVRGVPRQTADEKKHDRPAGAGSPV